MNDEKDNAKIVMGGMGTLYSLITLLVEKVSEIGGAIEDIYFLVGPEGLDAIKRIARIIVEASMKVLSLEKLIARGRYYWVNPEINVDNFPVDHSARMDDDTRIFYFDKLLIKTEEIEEIMNNDGWKPANLWNLLLYAIKNPQEPRLSSIYAIGEILDGAAPCLCMVKGKRYLKLIGKGFSWVSDANGAHILAVRK